MHGLDTGLWARGWHHSNAEPPLGLGGWSGQLTAATGDKGETLLLLRCSRQDKVLLTHHTDQRQQKRVEVSGGAARVHAEHLAALLHALVDRAPQTRQQHLALPQTVDVNRKSSQVLRQNQL